MIPSLFKRRPASVSLITSLLTVTLFGCTKDVQQPAVVQKQAVWVSPKDVPSQPDEALERDDVRFDYQKAASDLGIVVSAPTTDASAELKVVLDDQYARQRPYDPILVRSWVQAVIGADPKISKTLTYGAGMTIGFVDESKTLVEIFESMLSKKGTARIEMVIYNKGLKNQYSKFVNVPVGGDLIPALDRYVMAVNGKKCDKVLCALTSIFGSEDSVYDALFLHLRFKYVISLMVPRRFLRYTPEQVAQYSREFPWVATQYAEKADDEARYQNQRYQHRIFNSDIIRRIVKSLWALPETFHGLSSVYTILGAESKPTDRDPIFKGYAGFFYKQLEQSGNGAILLNIESQKGYETKIEFESIRERVQPYAVELNERMGMKTIIHEFGHAYDNTFPYQSPGGTFDKDTVDEQGRTVGHHYGYSFSRDWLALSGWYFIDIPESRRKTSLLSNLTHPPGVTYNYEFWPGGWALNYADKETVVPASRYDYPRSMEFNFVRSYAKTNPVEDFAEHLAFSVIEPDLTKEVAPEKFRFIDSKVLQFRRLPKASYKSSVVKEKP